jgi:hypothetical protein
LVLSHGSEAQRPVLIGADGGIYEQAGAPTGYRVEIRTYIVGPRGEFPVDANGTVSGDPFEEFADAVEESL